VIDRDPAHTTTLRAIVNGSVVATRPDRRVSGIRIIAGNGSDSVTIDQSAGPIATPVTVYGGLGDDEITGGSGRDLLDGGSGRDSLDGGNGNDRLRGGPDANRLEGGAGADNLRGGPENDTIWGGDGDDRLEGLDGRDRMQGGDGRDTVLGGAGDDTLVGHGDDPASDNPTLQARALNSDTPPDSDLLDGGDGDNVLVGDEDEDSLRNGREPESLELITSCADVAQRLAEQAQNQYGWYFNGGWSGIGRPGGFVTLDAGLNGRFETFAADLSSSASPGGAAASSFSGTNTQEQGVDEADIVKTDGNFIYVLRNNELILVDALPADTAAVVSRTEIEGYPIDMFLRGSRIMVFSSVFVPTDDPGPDPVEIMPAARSLRPIWFGGKSQVKLTVLDASSPESPTTIHETFLDGSYINSRMIDGRVYLIMNNSPQFPTPWLLAVEDGQEVESPEHFKERLAATDPTTFLPQFRSVDYTETGVAERTGNVLVDCGGVYKTANDDWMNLTTVLSFDLDADTIGGPLDSATVFGYVNTVYASTQNLYLINQNWHSDTVVSGIHKIALGDDIRVEASGEVPGTVLNQFSVDEQGPYLRVATNSPFWGSGSAETGNNVYVLSQEDATLNVVGSLEGLAPDETIFAARFFDDTGFVVTFRQVDPLFALDLSDPTDPQVAGQLKVNGFSRYLHPVGDDHLLAIGRDADDTGRTRGLQVSLFDVSDLNNPTRVDQFLIQPEGGWSWSAAEWDHHAFSFFPESGVMAVPTQGSVMIPAVDDGDPATFDYPTYEYRSDFWVFHVDAASGFDLLGQVEHDSTTLRSIRINELLYTLAYDDIKVQPLLDPPATVNQVSLE
jgi:uncharacterized secreted protein with C-terminal beta-propeller domain